MRDSAPVPSSSPEDGSELVPAEQVRQLAEAVHDDDATHHPLTVGVAFRKWHDPDVPL